MAKFKRVLVKLSGEALLAPDGFWLSPQTLMTLARDLAETAHAAGALVIAVADPLAAVLQEIAGELRAIRQAVEQRRA